jgi:transposase-like protein
MRKRRRFTPEFKAKVVLEVLTGAQSPAEACCKHALSPNLLGLWKAAFLDRAHTLFRPDEQLRQRAPARSPLQPPPAAGSPCFLTASGWPLCPATA